MRGFTRTSLQEMLKVPEELAKALAKATKGEAGEIDIMLRIESPPHIERFQAALKEVMEKREWLDD
jgi:hypothetical protein